MDCLNCDFTASYGKPPKLSRMTKVHMLQASKSSYDLRKVC